MGADMGRFSKQEAVAYHEAGHAVMAYHRQRGMKYATIEAAERGGGHLQHTKTPGFRPDRKNQDARIKDEILILLAGPQAERKKRGRWNHKGAAADGHTAVDLALYVCVDGEEATAYLQWLQIICQRLVGFYWHEIDALAAQLLVHKRLEVRRIRAIIKAAEEEKFQE